MRKKERVLKQEIKREIILKQSEINRNNFLERENIKTRARKKREND